MDEAVLLEIPITIRVHEQNQTMKVYYEPSGNDDANKIAKHIKPGDRVRIVATVHEVLTSGGYHRSNREEVLRHAGFTLDIGDIVLHSRALRLDELDIELEGEEEAPYY